MYANKDDTTAIGHADLMLSDDIDSLKQHLKTGVFDYVDIASVQAWKKSLNEWPLLKEWDEWSNK